MFSISIRGIPLPFRIAAIIFFGSPAFLPAESIAAIGPAAGRTYVVEHDSPEIGGPLIVSREVGQAILVGLGRVVSKV